MNRAALAARTFLVVALLPAIVAAGYAAYAFRHQPPIAPGTYRQFKFAPLISGRPTPGLLLGTYAPGSGADGLVGFDQAVGGRAALTVRYVYWGNTFPAAYVAKAAALGAETVVELEPIGKAAPTLAQIAAGAQDKWLRKFAHEIIAPQDHFILSFAPEMNGAWYQYGYGKAPPSEYVAAFRHVHDVLAATAAARLITYLWQPSAIHLKTPSPAPYWPGSKYVDEIGVDGYYFFPTDTFRVIFAKTLVAAQVAGPHHADPDRRDGCRTEYRAPGHGHRRPLRRHHPQPLARTYLVQPGPAPLSLCLPPGLAAAGQSARPGGLQGRAGICRTLGRISATQDPELTPADQPGLVTPEFLS